MDPLVQVAHSVSPAAAGLLLASIWQGVLLTAGVAIALRLLRSVSAAARTAIWTAVLLAVLVLPGLVLLVPHAVPAGHTELHVAQVWSVALLALWAILSVLRGAQLAANVFRLWKLARRATPVAVEPHVAALLQGSRSAQLCTSREVDRPSVAGFFRPRVLLPLGLIDTLSPAELEHVVLHEMEHLRRYDDWLNLLQQISLVLLPLNPALVWLDRRLCQERELACDDGVLAATHARKAYAACLVKLAEDSLVRKGVVLALSALGTRARQSEFVGRVRRILAGPENAPDAGRTPLAVAFLTVATAVSATLLACSPQWVRFDVGVSGPAEVASMSPTTRAPVFTSPAHRMLPVSLEVQGAAHPVLANAVLTRAEIHRQLSGVRRVAAVAVTRKKARTRQAGLRAGVESVPATAVPGAEQVWTPTAHVVLTEFEVSQPVYAAVPWQDGWLIVQL